MFKPGGLPAHHIDKVMLLAIWVEYLKGTLKLDILFAGMGNPTFPVNSDIATRELEYWIMVQAMAEKARKILSKMHRDKDNEAYKQRDEIASINATLSYENPQGRLTAREKVAGALNRWYGEKLNATRENVFLPVGGAGALYSIFHLANKKNPKGVIVTPVPHYTLYQGAQRQNNLHPIHVMQEKGYKLTAGALARSLENADEKNLVVNAFLFCDPNNPLGTVTDSEEWIKIAQILRKRLEPEKALPLDQKTPIILDEAYAEMGIHKQPVSLLTIAPDLAEHIVLLRSGTKGLSAAGERMALLFSKNAYIVSECVNASINIYGHAPTSSQLAFAAGLDSLNTDELNEMASHYGPQLDLVYHRAKEIGIDMPDLTYKPEGTFYVLLDLSDLIGQPLDQQTTQALGQKERIKTDEDISYHLLFKNNIMICPGSYFGLPPQKGIVRVTCSIGDTKLNMIMDRISNEIQIARSTKRQNLLAALDESREKLKRIYKTLQNNEHEELALTKIAQIKELSTVWANENTPKQLKQNNKAMALLLQETMTVIHTIDPKEAELYLKKNHASATVIQTTFRQYRQAKRYITLFKERKIAVDNAMAQLYAGIAELRGGKDKLTATTTWKTYVK